MFQYAMGYAHAARIKAVYKINNSAFTTYPLHHYALNDLSITAPIATEAESTSIRGTLRTSLVRRIIGKKPTFNKNYIRERAYTYDASYRSMSGDLYFEGYWQSEKYFLDAASSIRTEFTVRHEPNSQNATTLQSIAACESVAVHVRRGDYVQNKKTLAFHGVLPVDYYQRAVREIQKYIQHPTYYIFSDDPVWVRANLRFVAPTVYVNHNGPKKDYEDLRLMASCKHHIIANSTFSWWGAWLAEHPGQKVIAPIQWFASNQDTHDLIPDRWMRT